MAFSEHLTVESVVLMTLWSVDLIEGLNCWNML